MFGTTEAVAAAQALIRLRKHYTNTPKTERGLDPIFFGYITAAHPKVTVTRQSHVTFYGATKPSRIDFRLGGTNPTYLELAVRPEDGQQQLCGPQNHDELIKLSKIVPSKGKRRILLLVDLKKKPMTKVKLKNTYDPLHAGPGKKSTAPCHRCLCSCNNGIFVHVEAKKMRIHVARPNNSFKPTPLRGAA